MAGTVGLFTGKPFDYGEGTKGAISLKLGTNQYTQDTQPRVAALYSHNWDDKFGVAFSAAYSKRDTTEQGHNTYNYSHLGATDFSDPANPRGDAFDLLDAGLDISHLTPDQLRQQPRVSARRGFQVILGIVAVHDINVGHDERHPERCTAHASMMGASTANPL